ncbi:hypothetical protein [Candidatus Protochlamydia phocaeensis]|uniref:hypothetical protein n=1 Tax=Candidatus Protochlamydia phocaeensis TaxID=1414722 RepID=UPI000837B608|nr:hypothetical protein [Candidatus Protochlamydia phocaeensis]
MSFSTKLRAEYAELANQYLDNIPVEKSEDFELIKEALQTITDSSVVHPVPKALESRVKAIKDLIEAPELFVQDRKDYDEFKGIILQRVVAKIQEINNLSIAEKERYIAVQKELKEKTTQEQSIMANRQPPSVGSPGHVISESEWHMQQQVLFQQEANVNPNALQGGVGQPEALNRRIQESMQIVGEMNNAGNVDYETLQQRLQAALQDSLQIVEGMNAPEIKIELQETLQIVQDMLIPNSIDLFSVQMKLNALSQIMRLNYNL